MPDDALNPYAPPIAAEPLAPPEAARLWMVHGDHLLVRDGARLPPVSLFGEDERAGLTTSHQVFASASGTAVLVGLVPIAMTLLVMVVISLFFQRVAVLEGAATFLVISRLLLRRFPKASRPMANIQCHLSIAALKARAQRDRWRSRLTMTALAAFVLLLLGDKIQYRYTWGDDKREYLWAVRFTAPMGLLMLACFLGSLFWLAMERGLKCVSQTGGWFYLSGVPGSSLAKLAAMSGETPPVRPRKAYTLYQYRLPLGILLGPRRNPILILLIAVMKVLRSPAFVRRNFHWSEGRRGVQPDEELAGHIAKLRSQPEFASWLDLGCGRLDSPQGELRVLTARFASPDRRHFCHITLARISKARAYVAVCQTDFRTWTTDGRTLITSGQPPFPKLPGYLEFQRVRGGTARRWSAHLRRCERVTPRVLDDEELKALLEKEADDHAALLEAAGIYGAVEEVKMPGDWDELAKAP